MQLNSALDLVRNGIHVELVSVQQFWRNVG